MSEALAAAGSVAGLISLADATVRALKSLCNVISRIKHSSAEIRKVHSELRAIERLISEIQAYCRDYETTPLFGTRLEALKENLNSCQKEFETLRSIFKQPLTPPVNAFSRFGKKMKFVYNEHAISQSCLNLGRQQQMIVVSLSILGRRNDIDLRKAVDSVDQHFVHFQRKTTHFQASLQSQLNASNAEVHGSLKKIHKRMENEVYTHRNLEKSLKNENSKTLQQLQHHSQHFSSLGESTSRITHQLNTLTDQFGQLTTRSADLFPGVKLNFKGSFLELAAPLGIMKSTLGAFVAQCTQRCTSFRKEDIYWLEGGIRNLFNAFDFPRREGQPICRCHDKEKLSECNERFTTSQKNSRAGNVRTHQVFICLGSGHAFVSFKSTRDHQLRGLSNASSEATISFVPNPDVLQTGFLIEFSGVTGFSQRIHPTLTTFRVASPDSDIFRFVAEGNVDGVIELFRANQATPTDRNENGEPLLELAILHKEYEMFQFLVNQGATPQNSATPGRPVISWMCPHIGFFKDDRNCKILEWCLTSVEDANEIFESYLYPHDLFSELLSRVNDEVDDRPYLLHHLRECLEPDFECRNSAGRPPLLQVLFCAPIDVVARTKYYLENGADPHTVDYEGNGPFHIILSPTEDTEDPEKCTETTIGYRLKHVLQLSRLFFEEGCDPSVENCLGYTPSDLALWSPGIWFAWCAALEMLNIDIGDMLALEDRKRDLPKQRCWAEIGNSEIHLDAIEYSDDEDQEWQEGIRKLLLVFNERERGDFPFDAWTIKYVDWKEARSSMILTYLVPALKDPDQAACELDVPPTEIWTFEEFINIKRKEMGSKSPGKPDAQGRINWTDLSQRKWDAFQLYQQVRQSFYNFDDLESACCILEQLAHPLSDTDDTDIVDAQDIKI